jgi:hydroxymethylpyrimidine pyrophosphatase-like HAD family hydrolase/energy-coupling factor transporter ATP-binding protein EcfA2
MLRYLALATDYDGTLAHEGIVAESTLQAVRRLKESGRRAVLVTGRELSDLRRVFPELGVFDRIVAENGAHVFAPDSGEELLLGAPPPPELAELLKARGVTPLSLGRVIVATWEPHQHTVLEAIKELGLELQVIFNKGAVMVLPSGVNKASGLRAALKELGLSPHNAVGVGDAENDHALLAECELGVALANALPMLKERADLVTQGERGAGVEELIAHMIDSDLSELAPQLARRDVVISREGDDAAPVVLHPYGRRVLLCGTSGSGKSTLATAFLERLHEARYQYCLIDPEGDFEGLEGAVALGNEQQAPKTDDVLHLLRSSFNSSLVNLLGLPLEKRSAFFASLLARLEDLRQERGRPHWIVVDEAHHMLPDQDVMLPDGMLAAPTNLLLITVHPERLATQVLKQIDTVIVVGDAPREMLHSFAERSGCAAPSFDDEPLGAGNALLWRPQEGHAPQRFVAAQPKLERRRHRRKYAAGELGEDKSFYFRGPEGRLNLRAHNLQLFLQIADGVDDETWLHHLARHDYSAWLREAIKNDDLAAEVERIEAGKRETARASRAHVREAIERVYTAPA